MKVKDFILKIHNALNEFVQNEQDLLIQDIHEEAISGKLIHYLANPFSEYDFDIDTQYNKRILDNELIRKQAEFLITSLPLNKWPLDWEAGQVNVTKEILPDIIFHDRKNAERNFLIMELKKSTNKDKADRAWDFIKLTEMTSRDLNYSYGLFLEFNTGNDFNIDKPYSFDLFYKGEIIYKE